MKKILQKAILLGPALVLSTPLTSQTLRSGEPPVSVTAFASAIALSGGTVFVGRPGELSFFPAPASHSGTVHAFGLTDDGSWDEHEVISGAGSEPGDGFGDALAASGDVLVVGAPRANSGRGTVYIFERGEMGWGAG
ncbi:MAG: FG-GAP repeat protein, partial [Gemmatimonadetes bacterium]|nr:FG-GAP repeat protein [Gemmatimonadota bacterium]